MSFKSLILNKINGTYKKILKIKNSNIYSICVQNFENIILSAGFSNIEAGKIEVAAKKNRNIAYMKFYLIFSCKVYSSYSDQYN
ncbi:MAG TPA: hypothetical protein QF753_08140 [Victivallales bacterium]|nr:hypothetical protein [Victivallales bacterium]